MGFRTTLATLVALVTLGATACGATPQTSPTIDNLVTNTPTVSATYTPTAVPTATPEPVYQEVQGVRVPTNIYLEGDSCIPMELQGQEKCVNMFVYGTSPVVPDNWEGIVNVIGDIEIRNLTIEPGTEVYVTAHNDINNLFTYPGNMLQGINETHENIEGVHYGEYFYDEGNHITINVTGELYAVGTEEEPILITSDAAEPTRWDWNELIFRSGIMEYNIVEYSRPVHMGGEHDAGVPPETIIKNSIIRHTGGAGLFVLYTNIVIDGIQIYDPAHEGIGGLGVSDGVDYQIIRNSTIGPILGYICIGGDGKGTPPEIYDNIIQGCEHGIYFLPQPEQEFPVEDYLNNNEFINVRVKFSDTGD